MNSTNEGLYYEVPLIVIPQSADQPVIAQQVEHLGVGIKLQMHDLTVSQLSETVNHIVEHSNFQKTLTDIGESFRKSGGYHQAVDEIFKFKKQFNI